MTKPRNVAPVKPPVAVGPGPRWWRRTLAVIGTLYLIALVKHPPQWRGLHAIGFFTESTSLFPRANLFSMEYRLDAWSCSDQQWHPIDPRAYFPIQADDKESRFQRLGYFYTGNRTVMNALDEFIYNLHDTRDDGFSGQIGGIRMTKWSKPIPPVGTHVERYEFRPLEPPPADETKELYYTKSSVRRSRCAAVR
jgi:hypothetical protein